MRDQQIIERVNNAVTAAAKPDFADLLRRIEADKGESTAPQLTAPKSGSARVFAYTAAGIAAAAALGTMAMVGLSMDGAKSESFAADMECEAPMASESINDSYSDTEWDNTDFAASSSESVADEESVSASDVSASDLDGENE